jgi:hypothetical protein
MAGPDVYTAEMGNPPVEEDAGILNSPYVKPPRNKLAPRNKVMPPKKAPLENKEVMPPKKNPLDRNVYTADKGKPPVEEDAGILNKKTVNRAKGGSISSASSRADGCVTKGKTKGRYV